MLFFCLSDMPLLKLTLEWSRTVFYPFLNHYFFSTLCDVTKGCFPELRFNTNIGEVIFASNGTSNV